MLPRNENAKARAKESAAASAGQPSKPATGEMRTAASGSPVSADSYLPQLSPEEKARFRAFEEQTRKIRELGTQDPEALSRLLRVWLTLGQSEQEDVGETLDKTP